MATKLGKNVQVVLYTDSNGYEKPALITGTRKSIQEGTQVPRPDKGHANLFIISPLDPKSRNYTRNNIPMGEGPRTFRLLGAGEAANQDALVGAL